MKTQTLVAMILAAAALTACDTTQQDITRNHQNRDKYENRYQVICLDGVEYWHWRESHGYQGYESLAVKIDPETLQPSRCNRRT